MKRRAGYSFRDAVFRYYPHEIQMKLYRRTERRASEYSLYLYALRQWYGKVTCSFEQIKNKCKQISTINIWTRNNNNQLRTCKGAHVKCHTEPFRYTQNNMLSCARFTATHSRRKRNQKPSYYTPFARVVPLLIITRMGRHDVASGQKTPIGARIVLGVLLPSSLSIERQRRVYCAPHRTCWTPVAGTWCTRDERRNVWKLWKPWTIYRRDCNKIPSYSPQTTRASVTHTSRVGSICALGRVRAGVVNQIKSLII